ncbi:MAG: BrnT family toxin [Phycisphaeraceae bacterium]|nr:BrnT family toxin [Phycisphaeraceae bacterium]
MPWVDILWDDHPDGNVEHIGEHGITPEEVRQVLEDPGTDHSRSASSGRPLAMGFTAAGRFLVVVYEEIDAVTIRPITAYEPE